MRHISRSLAVATAILSLISYLPLPSGMGRNQAIKLNPRFADAWFNRATYWKAKGDLERAEAEFTRALS